MRWVDLLFSVTLLIFPKFQVNTFKLALSVRKNSNFTFGSRFQIPPRPYHEGGVRVLTPILKCSSDPYKDNKNEYKYIFKAFFKFFSPLQKNPCVIPCPRKRILHMNLNLRHNKLFFEIFDYLYFSLCV